MALPCFFWRVSVSVSMVFKFVNVINSEQGAGEGGEFTEGDEEGLVDLSLRVDVHAAEEEDAPAASTSAPVGTAAGHRRTSSR